MIDLKPIALGAATACAVLLVGCGGGSGGNVNSTARQACESIGGTNVPGVGYVFATPVDAEGAVPNFCKISGTLSGKLNFELRLPEVWNGKLHYGGGGGYNGAIPGVSENILAALKQGYATVSSDSGHQGSALDASFALNDPQAAQLFGSQSVPTVMSAAQALLRTAYNAGPTRSYFEGCSNGGREALMSAQRNPTLFDGIIARAPAYNWTGLMGAFNRTAKALAAPGGQFSNAKLALLAGAVRNACDGLDGVNDGVVSNQAACSATFDAAALRCPGGVEAGNSCLSDAQLGVVASWVSPAVFAGGYRNAGWNLTGNEDDAGAWPVWETGNGKLGSALQFLFQDTTVKNYLALDPAANSLLYSPYDRNPAALNAMAALNDATSTDLRPFNGRGAKLILWHGGSDAALSVNSTSEYYAGVVSAVGGQGPADTFVRYYVAPGVNHCTGGPGADSTDLLTALDAWVTKGTAPETLTAQKLATDGSTELARPLCRYPLFPRYSGPANNPAAARLATNFVCSVP